LSVGAVKNCHFRVGVTFATEGNNLVGHKLGFIVGGIPGEANNFFTGAKLGKQIFGFAIKVVPDDGVRRIQNVLGGAVVLFQQNDLSAREVPLKFGDVANISTPERINGLVRVTHHRQGCPRNCSVWTPGPL
jgi:hypothetical protein